MGTTTKDSEQDQEALGGIVLQSERICICRAREGDEVCHPLFNSPEFIRMWKALNNLCDLSKYGIRTYYGSDLEEGNSRR